VILMAFALARHSHCSLDAGHASKLLQYRLGVRPVASASELIVSLGEDVGCRRQVPGSALAETATKLHGSPNAIRTWQVPGRVDLAVERKVC
jgi:hypothetical protein